MTVRSSMRLASLIACSTLLLFCALAAAAAATPRASHRLAGKVARMAADSLVARHRAMPEGGWAWRSSLQAPHYQTDRDVGAASIGQGLLAAYAGTDDARYRRGGGARRGSPRGVSPARAA